MRNKKVWQSEVSGQFGEAAAICHATPHLAAASSLREDPGGSRNRPAQIFIFIAPRDF